jgi:hypothetical protein
VSLHFSFANVVYQKISRIFVFFAINVISRQMENCFALKKKRKREQVAE